MIICDICTGRHLTSACVIGHDHITAVLTSGTPDDFDPASFTVERTIDLSDLFALKRERQAADRAAREAERAERRSAAARQRNLRYRTRLRLVS